MSMIAEKSKEHSYFQLTSFVFLTMKGRRHRGSLETWETWCKNPAKFSSNCSRSFTLTILCQLLAWWCTVVSSINNSGITCLFLVRSQDYCSSFEASQSTYKKPTEFSLTVKTFSQLLILYPVLLSIKM